MIARVWTCRVPAAQAEAFFHHLLATGVVEAEATPGNLGAHVLRRLEGATAHFVMTSYWESRQAIRAFAGDDMDKAWLHPDDARFDLDADPTVTHFDVLHAPQMASSAPRT